MTELILNDIEDTWCPNGYCRARFDPCLCRVELVLDDERGESHERRFDLVTALRRREDEFGSVRLRELGHVPFLELAPEVRSALFTTMRIGTFPTTCSTPSIQSSRSSRVRRRVRSATARMPFAP